MTEWQAPAREPLGISAETQPDIIRYYTVIISYHIGKQLDIAKEASSKYTA